jgi:hypothetical protein
LETGPVATPFEFEPVEATLRKCQRYYWRAGGALAYERVGVGFAEVSTKAQILAVHPVPMRVAPTAADFSTLAVYDGQTITSVTSLAIESGRDATNVLATVASGLTQYRPYSLITNNSTSGYFGLTAEL